ncbi:MAG: ATP-binding cassette domain-containing protein [Prevotella sp.]|nr:ATP-binding cassette domain-containing protein [Prevotella sp.]
MIDIHDISYRYPGQKQPVFSDFSLKLSENRIYGLLGKNGTGKSTLLYLIAGLLSPKTGTVRVDAVDAKKRQADRLADIFLVSEEFELPALSLDAYVALIEPFYPRFSHEVLNRCLEAFELPTSLDLHALSMGQKKKVYMSIALAANTRLLLMDEPTNGLDIPSKSQFRKVVAENMSDDRTLIISTHQVHDVEQLLDHVLFLSERELLMDAEMSDLTDRYVFEVRTPQEMDDTVIYAEPSLQGNMVMARRQEGQPETLVNLELLFNAVTKGLVK